VEVPLLLQFSIALFTGMVAATLVPPVRRSIPRPVEIGLWLALVIACLIGVISITNPHARELTTSAFWGVDQVINTLVGLFGAGILSWIADHRFTIATGLVLVFAIDCFVLAMVRSYRQARAWQPQVRLGEWMELPRLAPATEPVVVPYAVDELNRKWAAAFAVAGAALLAWLVNFSIWARDVLLPRQAERLAHATAAGRVESRARLESLRDTASQLVFAARSWYVAAGAPAVNGLAAKASDAGRMADIHVLLKAQSIGWYGPLRPAATVSTEEEEEDDATGQADRLAS
jgi:hypothetical protein